MLNKKNITLISALGTLISIGSVFLSFNTPINRCEYELTMPCVSAYIFLICSIFVPIFIFSLVIYWTKEEVFFLWKKFTCVYLFIHIFLVIVNHWIHSEYSPFEKESVAISSLAFYFLLSLILITYKSIKLRGK